MSRIDNIIGEAKKAVSEATVTTKYFKSDGGGPQEKAAYQYTVSKLRSGEKVFVSDVNMNQPNMGVIVITGPGITLRDAEQQMRKEFGRVGDVVPIDGGGAAADAFPNVS